MGADTDRLEALHLIIGFCRDYGLQDSFKVLCQESGVNVNAEELAPHVSLMRLLLDWKRAFEARFAGTPRIIQPVAKPTAPQAVLPAPQPLMHGQLGGTQVVLNSTGGMDANASQHLTPTSFAQLQPGAATQDGQLQTTVHYTVTSSGPASVNGQATYKQPAQIFGQAQQLPPHFAALQQPQPLGLPQSQQPLASGDTLDANNGLLPRQPINTTGPTPLPGPSPSAMLLGHLPPRLPNGLSNGLPNGLALPAHSSSLYSTGDVQDASRDNSTLDWQLQGADAEETGHSRGGGHWVHVNGPTNTGPMAAVNGKRVSSSGAGPSTTKLRGGTESISQDTFLAVIKKAGPGSTAASLFDFRRPQRGGTSTARRSAILNLDEPQHDAMYALAGCEDVNFLISNVQSEVRQAMNQVFGIDKESFTVWFKNRGRNPSKMNTNSYGTGTRQSNKRGRMSEGGALGMSGAE